MTDLATDKAHASLGASKAHRWMVCHGSLKMEAPYPDTSSSYADEGTAAHELMEWCLTSGQDAASYAGRIITVEKSGRKFEVDEEMVENVQQYVDYVRDVMAQDPDAVLMVETTVDFGRYLFDPGTKWPVKDENGEIVGWTDPEAYGTADTIVILPNLRKIVDIDLKYGKGERVDAERNPQLMLYGLGALEVASLAGDFDTVELVIHQPRIENGVSSWEVSVEDLEQFALEARIAARHAVHQLNDGAPPKLVPGPKQCRFCKAKASCPAYVGETTSVATTAASVEDFEDLTVEKVEAGLANTASLTLAQMMDKIEMLEALPKAIRAEVERRLTAGEEVPGYKLVEGKRGNRAWVNADEAELQMKSMRLKVEEMYELKLISPTAAEKLAKAGKIGPRQWKKLQDQYAQSPGKPSVAPADDKRPAITVAATADDFAVLDDSSDLV